MKACHVNMLTTYIIDPSTKTMKVSIPTQPCHRHIDVTLHPPSTDAECAIMQEPITTATLDAFPRPFYKDHPTHTAITLKCGHTFHAMALVYHWARNHSVLCPICRDGMVGQKLTLARLPKEWRYSMAARVRRERKQDQDENDAENMSAAVRLVQTPPMQTVRFSLKLKVEADNGSEPAFWLLDTIFIPLPNAVLFDVPYSELVTIPYRAGARVRFVPFTTSYHNQIVVRSMEASPWFVAGSGSAGANFGVACDDRGWHHIHFSVQDETFAEILADMYVN